MPKTADESTATRRQASELLFAAWSAHAKARQEVVHAYQKRCRDAHFAWVSAQQEIRQVAWTRLHEAHQALVVALHTPGASVETAQRAWLQAQYEFQCGLAMRDQFAQAYQAYVQALAAADEESRKALAVVESDQLRAFKKGVASIDPDAMEPATLCSLRLVVGSFAPDTREAATDKSVAAAAA
jgi:hypothetical protein